MIYYLKGVVRATAPDFLIMDVQGIGFKLYASHPQNYEIGKDAFMYTHFVIKEEDQYIVGLANKKEKEVFETLLKVKGIGPKSAISALRNGNPDEILNAIASRNVTYLRRLPAIGLKGAQQIILDLGGYGSFPFEIEKNPYDDVAQALKEMGFKRKIIDEVLASINIPNATNEEILKAALTKLRSSQ